MSYEHQDVGTVTEMNTELEKIEQSLKTKLSRESSGERTMTVDLDMNSNRILNLRKPISPNEPVRLQDLADYEGGGGIIIPPSGGGIRYVTAMPTELTTEETLYNQNSYDLGFTFNDGDTTQILEFSLAGAAAYGAGSGGGSITIGNAGGTGNTLVNNPSVDLYSIKRIKAGANITITDDGNALTVNSSGGGGGGGSTTLSNAGAIGLPLVQDISGSNYPIRRIQAGTNVTITDNGTYYTINSSGGGGGISSVQNVNDAVGTGIYKETSAGIAYFRRVLSSDNSLSIASDFDDVDFTVNAVPFTKISTVPTARLLGRTTASTGAAEAISVGSGLTLSGGVLSASGVTDGDKGDVVVSGSGGTWTLDPTVVTALARTLIGNSTVNAMLGTLGIITITNANGTTLRFPTAGSTSGIQICFKTGLSTGAISTASGSMFIGSGEIWAFPNAFSAPPAVTGFVTSASAAWIGGGASATDTAAAYFRGYSAVSGTTATVCMIAIGTY